MDENEWSVCTEPKRMLRFLLGTNYPRIQDVEAFPACRTSDRKLRLFACHCYYRVRHLLVSPLAEAAVAVAEQFADGITTMEDLQRVHALLQETLGTLEEPWRASRGAERTSLEPTYDAIALALQVTRPEAPKAAYYASSNAYLAVASLSNPGVAAYDSVLYASRSAEERAQADVLREIVGPLPFRPIRIEAAWLSGTVIQVANAIYQEGRWQDMGVLADALEESGCRDELVLSHCRGPGPHAKGCYVADALLGRT